MLQAYKYRTTDLKKSYRVIAESSLFLSFLQLCIQVITIIYKIKTKLDYYYTCVFYLIVSFEDIIPPPEALRLPVNPFYNIYLDILKTQV